MTHHYRNGGYLYLKNYWTYFGETWDFFLSFPKYYITFTWKRKNPSYFSAYVKFVDKQTNIRIFRKLSTPVGKPEETINI